MCICCCETRKSLLISAIIISILSIIYGIITVSQFGHKSLVYKYLKAKLDSYDAIKDTLSLYFQGLKYCQHVYIGAFFI